MSEFIVGGDYNSYDSDGSDIAPVGISYFGGAKSDDSGSDHENTIDTTDSDSSSASESEQSDQSGALDELSFNGSFSDSDDETKETLGGSYIGLSEYGDIEDPVENNDVTGGAHKHSTGLSSKIMAEVTDLGGINEINGGRNGISVITNMGDSIESNESNESPESDEYVSPYFDSSTADKENKGDLEDPESYIEGPAYDSGDDARSKLDEELYIGQNSELIDVGDNHSDANGSELMTGGRSNNVGDEDSENTNNLSTALAEFLKAAEGLK